MKPELRGLGALGQEGTGEVNGDGRLAPQQQALDPEELVETEDTATLNRKEKKKKKKKKKKRIHALV